MLIIRRAQLHALALRDDEPFVDELCAHLRRHFRRATLRVDDRALRDRVTRGLARARGYGLERRDDLRRFLNLAAVYGWEFDAAPKHAWMRARLTDPDVSSPGERLAILFDRVLHRRRVAARNRALAAAHGLDERDR